VPPTQSLCGAAQLFSVHTHTSHTSSFYRWFTKDVTMWCVGGTHQGNKAKFMRLQVKLISNQTRVPAMACRRGRRGLTLPPV
jgi:hypothetical protein